MDIVEILGLYALGFLFALIFSGRTLTILSAIAAIIAIPFYALLMMDSLISVLAVIIWPLGLSALGFVCGGAAKSTFNLWAELHEPFKYVSYVSALACAVVPISVLVSTLVFQPDSERDYAKDFVKNTSGIPVQLGTDVLNIPIRGGINIKLPVNRSIDSYSGSTHPDALKEIEALIQEGPIEIENLQIGGLVDSYNQTPYINYNEKPKVTPIVWPEWCDLTEHQNSPRCKFIVPEFSLMFLDSSKNQTKKDNSLKRIRVIDGFDIVHEKWREPKTKGEKPVLSDIKLRAALPQDFDSKESPVFLECNRIREYYLCRTSKFYINDNQLVTYSFHAQEADIPKAFRESRSIASNYWSMLLDTYGDNKLKTP